MGRGSRSKKKGNLKPLPASGQIKATLVPTSLTQQSLSYSQQNTLILSPDTAISELQVINGFNEENREWAKGYLEKEQAHRHEMDKIREQNKKEGDDKMISIAGRIQMVGALGGMVVTLGLMGLSVFLVFKGWNSAAVVAFLVALLPFANAFFGRKGKGKDDPGDDAED